MISSGQGSKQNSLRTQVIFTRLAFGPGRSHRLKACGAKAYRIGSWELVPLNWAMTQSSLGTALEGLGERESGIARRTVLALHVEAVPDPTPN